MLVPSAEPSNLDVFDPATLDGCEYGESYGCLPACAISDGSRASVHWTWGFYEGRDCAWIARARTLGSLEM